MIRRLIPFFLVFAFACGDDTGKQTDTDTDTDTDSDTDTDTDTDDWPDGAPDWTTTGDLSEGEVIDISWAESSSVACWPATENMNFNGAHVIYDADADEYEHFYIRVKPESGVDVSLYALRFAGTPQYPPDITSAVCDAAYDAPNDHNPGEAETLFMWGDTDKAYHYVIGVAGAGNATSGGYTLETWAVPTR